MCFVNKRKIIKKKNLLSEMIGIKWNAPAINVVFT